MTGALVPTPGQTTGSGGSYTDGLWQVTVQLLPEELRILRAPEVRRLHFVAHAGAARLLTNQTYSRLEHSLGTLALVAHFEPENTGLRLAALLHDVGHLPFSHTLEGLGGLDHHDLGRELIAGLAPEALGYLDGRIPNPLTGTPGLMNLDHLDSYVRSARVNGWLPVSAPRLLRALRLTDHAVDTDAGTADVLAGLVSAEARSHAAWDNVAPVAMLRELCGRLGEDTDFTRLTDDELWALLARDPRTRDGAHRLRMAPHELEARAVPEGSPDANHVIRKYYLSPPLVDGQRAGFPVLAALDGLPRHFRVAWQDAVRG
ncbi:HD domain-containing protein [Longispora albida]|uniref:HD domain-containing protein n=1 Tax=Longispora albida TaxID=203523 RepID=UPI0003733364|nr:HD domain-containing protein [Longispora albida]